MHLGDVIKNYRVEHGKMSMQAFADKCGLSKGYIAMLERNINSKTGEPVVPSIETFIKVSSAMNMTLDELTNIVDENQPISLIHIDDEEVSAESLSIRIKVLGSVPAGVPLDAIEDIVDWEDIPREWTIGGKEFFGLKVKGDSMYPKYLEGDTIIVRKEDDCESGDDCVVYVNGYDATLKKVIKKQDCIILQPLNTAYDPKIYDYTDELNPIKIAGVVVEIRRKV